MRLPQGRSLVREVIGVVIATQLLCAALLAGLALLHERRIHLRTFDVRVQGRSDSLLGAIQDAEDPNDTVRVDPAELTLPEGDVYAVYNPEGRLLGTSNDAPWPLIARRGAGFHDVALGDQRYRVLQVEAMRVIDRAENGGVGLRRPVTIVYASSEGRVWHEIFEAVRFYLLAIAFATAASVAFVAVLLRKTLSPLSELVEAAGSLAPPMLDFAVPTSAMRMRELRPLANVLADTRNRLKDAFAKEQRFVSDAAHELKTAVAVVRSSVQLLMLKRRSAPEYEAGLERVLADNRRVEALIAQMLELAAVDERTMAESTPPLDLNQVVQAVVEHLEPLALQHRVKLRIHAGAGLAIRMRPEDARSVLTNLVLNAVQHSPAEAVVTITVLQEHGRNVSLRIADQGAGIAPEALPHLFERFYREDRSRSRATGGAGLGLSICKSIVERSGGSIDIRSSEGEGTEVTVIFMSA